MEIRVRKTGEVMTENAFRVAFKDRILPDQLTEAWLNEFNDGCDVVLEGAQPTTTPPYEYAFRNGVELIKGKWYTKYSVGPSFTNAQQMTEYKALRDAEQAKSVRSIRNQHLKDCDWTQGKDVPDAVSTPWAAYRQQLRDLPKQVGFPWNVEWPKQP